MSKSSQSKSARRAGRGAAGAGGKLRSPTGRSAAGAPTSAPSGRAASRTGRGTAPAGRPIPPKLYRIGEIIEYTGCSRQTIHNYTTMGLITESRRSVGGHRLYDESVFLRLELIARMKQQRRSMREIRGRLAGED